MFLLLDASIAADSAALVVVGGMGLESCMVKGPGEDV